MRTWYLLRNSFDSAEDIILRRTEDGAEKCSLRDLRREEETSVEIQDQHSHQEIQLHTSAGIIRLHLSREPSIHP